MMKYLLKFGSLACLLLLAVSLTGCVKFKQVMSLNADGSGKITLNVGLSDQLMQMAQQQGEDPFDVIDPMAVSEDAKGIVAFSKPTQEKIGGFTYVTFTAYFEDVNEVVLGSPGEPPAKFSFTKDGDSGTLSVEQTMILSAVADHEPVAEEEKQVAAAMTAGMSFKESYELPGKIEAIKGVAIENNTATIEMTQKHMLNSTGPIEDLKDVKTLTFKLTDIKTDAEAMAAFKAELEAAKKEWEAMKKEASE